ncbi:unnamed protein product [Protopolystoma xenopodis]|uniref:Uncharacterized protein n=1 Tax=Protopolystoma xenopodis TaxID=117903 RepID=A0A3S5AZI4_9PLAT|nr:unnamed protein product [Protopolystoma xenopodis]
MPERVIFSPCSSGSISPSPPSTASSASTSSSHAPSSTHRSIIRNRSVTRTNKEENQRLAGLQNSLENEVRRLRDQLVKADLDGIGYLSCPRGETQASPLAPVPPVSTSYRPFDFYPHNRARQQNQTSQQCDDSASYSCSQAVPDGTGRQRGIQCSPHLPILSSSKLPAYSSPSSSPCPVPLIKHRSHVNDFGNHVYPNHAFSSPSEAIHHASLGPHDSSKYNQTSAHESILIKSDRISPHRKGRIKTQVENSLINRLAADNLTPCIESTTHYADQLNRIHALEGTLQEQVNSKNSILPSSTTFGTFLKTSACSSQHPTSGPPRVPCMDERRRCLVDTPFVNGTFYTLNPPDFSQVRDPHLFEDASGLPKVLPASKSLAPNVRAYPRINQALNGQADEGYYADDMLYWNGEVFHPQREPLASSHPPSSATLPKSILRHRTQPLDGLSERLLRYSPSTQTNQLKPVKRRSHTRRSLGYLDGREKDESEESSRLMNSISMVNSLASCPGAPGSLLSLADASPQSHTYRHVSRSLHQTKQEQSRLLYGSLDRRRSASRPELTPTFEPTPHKNFDALTGKSKQFFHTNGSNVNLHACTNCGGSGLTVLSSLPIDPTGQQGQYADFNPSPLIRPNPPDVLSRFGGAGQLRSERKIR